MRSRHELWHKENIINLTVAAKVPPEAQYIGYLDGDITMSRHDWALEALHQLQHYDAVQLFNTFSDVDTRHRPLGCPRASPTPTATRSCRKSIAPRAAS